MRYVSFVELFKLLLSCEKFEALRLLGVFMDG